jgi:rubredoxin
MICAGPKLSQSQVIRLNCVMPLDYQCSQCRLGFSVGTYHYHSHASGYFGRTLLLCSNCGTQHAIEIPIKDDGEPYTLRSMPGPAVECETLDGFKLLFPKSEWTHPVPIPSHRTESLSCQHCGVRGTLTENVTDEWTCPNCSAPNKGYFSRWMT